MMAMASFKHLFIPLKENDNPCIVEECTLYLPSHLGLCLNERICSNREADSFLLELPLNVQYYLQYPKVLKYWDT